MSSIYALLIISISLSFCLGQLSNDTDIEGIRLTGSGNIYSGLVEVRYNGRWGTICERTWTLSDADVVCRMLGFESASCALHNENYWRVSSQPRVWISGIGCGGYETYLDQCTFHGWGTGFCQSFDDIVSVVCFNQSLVSVPVPTVVNTTTISMTLAWRGLTNVITLSQVSYSIVYTAMGHSPAYSSRYTYNTVQYVLKLFHLTRNTNYSISLRLIGHPYYCDRISSSRGFFIDSPSIIAATNSTIRPSSFGVRLVPAIRALNFTGRVEVSYKNSAWGTVCDYLYSIHEARVICSMLGYDGALCAVSNAQFGRGSDPIWLNIVFCSSAEVLEDCTYRNYSDGTSDSIRFCSATHSDDAGVVCQPDPGQFLLAPQNFSISDFRIVDDGITTITSTVTFRWKRYTFPSYLSSSVRFSITYTRSDHNVQYNIYPAYYLTSYPLSNLPLGITVSAIITAQGSLGLSGCSQYINGDSSNSASISTSERPPSIAPLNFNITAINCTALMARWDSLQVQPLTGYIRGYKLMYRPLDGRESTIYLPSSVTEYVVERLLPATNYLLSVLAYTVEDGPRSGSLSASTFDEVTCGLTSIEDIQLSGTGNNYSGRVELLYNGTWGTVCDNSWSQEDADTACRMLGFSGASCPLSDAFYGSANSSVPIWMDQVDCMGNESYLDECSFSGWGEDIHTCTSHSDDASVVCRSESFFSTPILEIVNTTTRRIAVRWPRVTSMITLDRLRYSVQYNTSGFPPRYLYTYYSTSSAGPYLTVISNLTRDTNYSISVRLEGIPNGCPSNSSYRAVSNYSTVLAVATNETVRPSVFDVRLQSSISGLSFAGQVEVNYNNSGWGTICDNQFGKSEADIICKMLSYENALCAVYGDQFGSGSDTIWLNEVSCLDADILDDCSFSFYGNSENCGNDVGVICRPVFEDFLPALQDFSIASDGYRNIVTFAWMQYSFPSYLSTSTLYNARKLRIDYTRSDYNTSLYSIFPSFTSTSSSIVDIPLGVTINATIRAQASFQQYNSNCTTPLEGATSAMASIVTAEGLPSGAPQNFEITVVNCSAIMATWDLPSVNQRNGIIRGFKLFYRPQNGALNTIDVPVNITNYIINGLRPATSYTVRVLAYTVGDGRRSIRLSATTNEVNNCQAEIITFFGINGNGQDTLRLSSNNSNMTINVYCGSDLPDVQVDWFYGSGIKVEGSTGHIRAGDYSNGTVVLQIGYVGPLTPCDGGIYICKANTSYINNTIVQQRSFQLTFDGTPPTPRQPSVLSVTSDTIKLRWPDYGCDGGYSLQYYNMKIGYYVSAFSDNNNISYTYINNIAVHLSTYTILGLKPSTIYYISIQAVSEDDSVSSYSSSSTGVTLPPAPGAPGSVSVQLVPPNTIIVSWTRPSIIYGDISYYTVYATPFTSETTAAPRTRRQTTPLQTVSKNFSPAVTSGSLILLHLDVEYHVQVSVTVGSGTNQTRESFLSPLTSNSTIFVPVQALPVPNDVRISATSNTSITISWNLPSTEDHITGFLVEYSAVIEGRSPGGVAVSYMHNGNSTVSSDASDFTVQPLVPQTNYQIKISALTTRGQGMEITISGTTSRATSEFERYAYFQVRFGPVLNCSSFRADLAEQEGVVNQQIFGYLRTACNCGFSDDNIIDHFFLCGQQESQIVYRAQIIGSSNYSATALVQILQDWIQNGSAYITLNNFRMQLDQTCTAVLDTLNDPECPVSVEATACPTMVEETPISTTTTYKTSATFKETAQTSDKMREATDDTQLQLQNSESAQLILVGIIIGVVIAICLILLIVIIIVIALWKFNKSNQGYSKSDDGTTAKQEKEVQLNDYKLSNM